MLLGPLYSYHRALSSIAFWCEVSDANHHDEEWCLTVRHELSSCTNRAIDWVKAYDWTRVPAVDRHRLVVTPEAGGRLGSALAWLLVRNPALAVSLWRAWPHAVDRAMVKDTKRVLRAVQRIMDTIEVEEERQNDWRPPTGPVVEHAEDFAWLVWFGRRHVFTPKQRAVVGELWQAWDHEHPGVSSEKLLKAADSDAKRLSDLFKPHLAWGDAIVLVENTKDIYTLWPPKSRLPR